jgi:hypothetical protein
MAEIQTFREYVAETYLTETSLARVWQHFGTPDAPAGIISAFTNTHSPKENYQRTQRLSGDVRAAGFGYVIALGHYKDQQGVSIDETPLLIAGTAGDGGKLKGLLRKWRAAYDQESVLFKPEGSVHGFMVYADHEDDLGTFHPNRISEWMTTVRGRSGGTFVFEEFGYVQMTVTEAANHARLAARK